MNTSELFIKLEVLNSDILLLEKEVNPINDKLRGLKADRTKYYTLLSAMQDVCEHIWGEAEYTNHGRMKWVACTICKAPKY